MSDVRTTGTPNVGTRSCTPRPACAVADAVAQSCTWTASDQAQRVHLDKIDDMEAFRRSFLTSHRTVLVSSLRELFGETDIEPAPIDKLVNFRFMDAMKRASASKKMREVKISWLPWYQFEEPPLYL
jgi:hypothetical protein